jgi:hypothetical protein
MTRRTADAVPFMATRAERKLLLVRRVLASWLYAPPGASRARAGLFAVSWVVGCGQVPASLPDATSAHDASRTALDASATLDSTPSREVGATNDADVLSDAGTCEPPHDATFAMPDGSLCLENGNCERGGIPCCRGSVCVPCAVGTSDGGYVLNVEAGPFYCNVSNR